MIWGRYLVFVLGTLGKVAPRALSQNEAPHWRCVYQGTVGAF